METTFRRMTFEETIELEKQLITVWGFIEKIGVKWLFLSFITIFPLLIFEEKVSSENQLIITIIDQLIIVCVILFWNKRDPELLFNKTLKKEIEIGEVEIVQVKSNRVFKRKDPEDFGTGYYFDLGSKIIFLQGQHLDVLNYSRKFPNTDFEIIRTKKEKILIDCKINGKFLKPEKILKAFTKEQYKSGDYHNDGQIIDKRLDEIE